MGLSGCFIKQNSRMVPRTVRKVKSERGKSRNNYLISMAVKGEKEREEKEL